MPEKPENLKETLCLYIYADLKPEEIAKIQKISFRQVFYRLKKAYEIIKKRVEDTSAS